MQKQLKTRQICLFFIAFCPITKLFTMPSILASITKNDLWLSSVINVTLDLLTIFCLYVLSKNTDKTFYEHLEQSFTKTGAKIIYCCYLLYFVIKGILPIIEQKDYIDATLYLSMPSIVYFIPFFILAFYLCLKQLRVLGRLADVLFLFTLSSYVMLIALSLNNADITAILPIGINGAKSVLKGTYCSLSWFGDGAFFIFFVGNFKTYKGDGVKIILSYLVNALMIIIFLIVFYGIFTSIAFRQKFALTEIAKYTSVISNTGRFDYFAIISLLFSSIISIALPLFFASKILQTIFDIKNIYLPPAIVVAISFIITVFLYQYYYSIQKIITVYLGWFMLVFGNLFPIIFSLIKSKGERYERVKN